MDAALAWCVHLILEDPYHPADPLVQAIVAKLDDLKVARFNTGGGSFNLQARIAEYLEHHRR